MDKDSPAIDKERLATKREQSPSLVVTGFIGWPPSWIIMSNGSASLDNNEQWICFLG